MSHPVPTNSHSRHSYSPSRPRYYAPPHHSQHPQMPSMWQPHLHHHPASHVHHPGHGSRPHPITHHYHMPHSLARPDDVVRPAPSVVDHSMYPSDRRDPNDHYSHRHRASYPPVLHASMPGPYSGLPNWKNTHYESQGLENPRHDEARKAPAVDIPSPDEDTEEPPVTAVEKSNNQDPEPTVMKSADKTAVSETAKQIVTVNSKEERATPGSTRKAASLLEEKFQQSLKSPVTMCFERFLGAAEILAQKSAMKKNVAGKENANLNIVCPSTEQTSLPDTATPASHRPVRLVDKFQGTKRTADEMEFGDDSNPFIELAYDRDLQRRVILHMALQRNAGDETGDGLEEAMPPVSGPQKTVIEDGFYWKEFPVCEAVLFKHMAEYYGISSVQRQSRMQQSFNKMLVDEVRSAAEEANITFDPSFTEKKLRDRIRCFYKTHLQNAKKRLVTLQKRPESANNQAIVRVYVRCVKTGISFAESLYMEPSNESQSSKRGRLSHVEKAKAALKREAAAEAARQEQAN